MGSEWEVRKERMGSRISEVAESWRNSEKLNTLA